MSELPCRGQGDLWLFLAELGRSPLIRCKIAFLRSSPRHPLPADGGLFFLSPSAYCFRPENRYICNGATPNIDMVMTHIVIEDSTPEGKWLLELIRGHASVTVVDESGKDFRQAVAACKGVPVKAFSDELRRRIELWPE